MQCPNLPPPHPLRTLSDRFPLAIPNALVPSAELAFLYVWIALVSTATFGLVTVLDKRLIDRHMPSLAAFYVSVGAGLILYALVVLALTGIPQGAPWDHLAAAGAAGLCWGAALGLMFWGYKYEEASRASAIIHTFPVFVAALAVTLLGETLVGGQWVAIVAVVAGAFAISLRGSAGGMPVRLNRAFPILVGASLFTALAHLTNKYALEELPVWFVYAVRNLGMGGIFLCLWRPGTLGELSQALRQKETLAYLLLAEYLLAPAAILLNVTATSLGPVSLVSTLTATRPLFVFIYGTILSTPALRLLDEPLDRNTLGIKLASVAVIVAGVAALTLL